jgi:hypothetical protein
VKILILKSQSYVKKLKEIANSDYVPTVDDILRSRAKTVGIVEQKFKYNGNLILKI